MYAFICRQTIDVNRRVQPAAHEEQSILSSLSSRLHPHPDALKVDYNCIKERSVKSLFKHIYDGHQPPKTAFPASTATARDRSAVPAVKKQALITRVLDWDPLMRQVKQPNGQLKYLFFLLDGQGRLVQQWLNLQQVQVMEHSDTDTHSDNDTRPNPPKGGWPTAAVDLLNYFFSPNAGLVRIIKSLFHLCRTFSFPTG